MDEMIGRSDVLHAPPSIDNAKAKHARSSALLHLAMPAVRTTPERVARHHVRLRIDQSEDEGTMNRRLVELAQPALGHGDPVKATLAITNSDRAGGGRRRGRDRSRYGIPDCLTTRIALKFNGSAGQSFGAFAAHGMSLELEGEANDYVGKGLSGGA